VILAGRRINSGMGAYVAGEMVKAMMKKRIHVNGSRILLLGLAFKENCPDLRNTKVVDIVSELASYGVDVDVYDPWVSSEESAREYGITPVNEPATNEYDGVVLAVAHDVFKEMGASKIREYCKTNSIIYDLKYLLSSGESDLRL